MMTPPRLQKGGKDFKKVNLSPFSAHLGLYARNRIIVLDYRDEASGTMEQDADGGGQFTEVNLRPVITLTPESDIDLAKHLHHEAHEKCFIARSVNFPVRCEPVVRT